jgi:nucleoside-diphosphate-sugar epimerase
MIIVTGSKGIIGRGVMKALSAKGYDTVGIHREYFDLSAGKSLLNAVQLKPEVVIHLAAAVPHSIQYPDSLLSANKTRSIDNNVFEAVSRWGCHVIYASTCSLYDKSDPSIKYENSPVVIKPNSHYMKAKHDGEQLFSNCKSSLIVRLPAPLGGGIPDTLVIKKFISMAMTNRVVEIWGSGRREQNYVAVTDIADGILYGLKNKVTGVYNLSADSPTTMLELAETVIKVVRKGSYKCTGQTDPNEHEYARYSNNKAKLDLGWNVQTTLEEAIRIIVGLE